jgi:DNA-binding PadR family transcriptional regulator
LYAALAKLAAQGLVEDAGVTAEPSAGPPRRSFRITALGRRVARLEANRMAAAVELASKRLGGGSLGRRRAT